MLVVDTNILVYAADESADEHPPCRAFVEELRADPSAWYVTWPILYEFLRIVTHRRVMRRPWKTAEAWGFVEALLAAPGLGFLQPTDRHREVAARTLGEIPHLRGSILHDAATAIVMREHGIGRIATHDTDFHRFPFLEVVDPVTGA